MYFWLKTFRNKLKDSFSPWFFRHFSVSYDMFASISEVEESALNPKFKEFGQNQERGIFNTVISSNVVYKMHIIII